MAIDPLNHTLQNAAPLQINTGLRAYMTRIYNYMALALLMTGAIAYGCAHSLYFLNAMYIFEGDVIIDIRPLAWFTIFAPLALVVYLSFALPRISLTAAQIGYWLYAALMGMSLSTAFLTFTDASVAQIFFVTAAMFCLMSFYGYTAKHNLEGLGAFLIMGLWGLIIAMLANLFLRSTSAQLALSCIGVFIFIGLTAYDTQKLKAMYYQLASNDPEGGKVAILGALALYLDFLNIFLNFLTVLGGRRR